MSEGCDISATWAFALRIFGVTKLQDPSGGSVASISDDSRGDMLPNPQVNLVMGCPGVTNMRHCGNGPSVYSYAEN
jgi:hypothetical protein